MFKALTANQTVTVGGMTFKSTGATTAANVAAAFANYTSGAAPSSRSSSFGTFSGTAITDFSSGAVSSSSVTFTSTTATANVTDLTTGGTGVSINTTQGGGAYETALVTFFDMSANDMVTLGNLSFVASQATTAAQVAALFRGKSSTFTPTTSLGTVTGKLGMV